MQINFLKDEYKVNPIHPIYNLKNKSAKKDSKEFDKYLNEQLYKSSNEKLDVYEKNEFENKFLEIYNETGNVKQDVEYQTSQIYSTDKYKDRIFNLLDKTI